MIRFPLTVVTGNQGNYHLCKVFFSSRTTKVLIFPLQMLHKILITKLLNNLTLPSIQLHVPLQQGQKPMMRSRCTPDSWQAGGPHTETLVPWPPERKRNWPISPSPVCMKKTQTGEAEPAGREPRPSVNFWDHLLHQQVWEAEARSAAAPLGLRRLSPELEALAARWRVGVGRRNSSTNFYKEFIYVYRIFRAGLHKNRMDGVGIVLSISLHDFSDVDKVTLIASDSHDDIGRAVLPELLHPVLQCWECLFFCDVVNNDGRSWAPIVHWC